MSTLTPPTWSMSQRPPFPVARFTVDQYHQMIRYGIVGEDDPVELLDGWITRKMPRNPPHDSTVSRLQRSLMTMLGPDWVVRSQCAVTLAGSEPEPDIAVATGPDTRYDDHHPRADEIALLVEVADSSLERDRETKARLYAAAKIPIYWIVNLPQRLIEVYDGPSGSEGALAYRQRREYQAEDEIPMTVFGRQVGLVKVRELLPSRAP